MILKSSNLFVEYWPIDRLRPYEGNARTHSETQIEQIALSIREFGFTNPILTDSDGCIIAGHGRLSAARKLGQDIVPVIVLAHLSDSQKDALRLADNQLALNAGWDAEKLRQKLQTLASQKFDLQLTGFSQQDLKTYLAMAKRKLLGADEAPRAGTQPVSRLGDLWVLGEHRLLCGDATRLEEITRALDGTRCDMTFTDLPYNVDYTGKTAARLKLANDNLGAQFEDFLLAACRSMLAVTQGALYICMSSSELHHLHVAFCEAGGHWSTYLIWAKSTFTLGRSDYQRQYEPILYGWRKGETHYWCGKRDQGDVWSIAKPCNNDLHPTMKPVALMERAVANSSRQGDVVLDPFGGSGSTLIACENLGRQARLLEIDPIYTDVIVRRWEAYTGNDAILADDGRTFAEVVAERCSLPNVA